MRFILIFIFALWPFCATAQVYKDDPAIGAGLARAFGTSDYVVGSVLLTDSADPAKTTEALGVLYTAIEGSASGIDIHVALLHRQGNGYAVTGRVSDLYGEDPRGARFLRDRIEVTTSTLRDSDGRCCPTGVTHWTIPRATLAARKN